MIIQRDSYDVFYTQWENKMDERDCVGVYILYTCTYVYIYGVEVWRLDVLRPRRFSWAMAWKRIHMVYGQLWMGASWGFVAVYECMNVYEADGAGREPEWLVFEGVLVLVVYVRCICKRKMYDVGQLAFCHVVGLVTFYLIGDELPGTSI